MIKIDFPKALVFTLFSVLAFFPSLSQDKAPVFETESSKIWADSVFETLSYQEKIGQLFMVDAFSNKNAKHTDAVAELIRSYHIGGVIFFQGGPLRQAKLTNYYQSISKIPLMVGIDGEWGLSMRLDSTIRFPRQMTLGAMNNDSLIYEMALEIGRQCRRMGIHLNFAPVADVNNNPLNPVINSRSFGEIKEEVARKSIMYMNGLQDQGVLACGKHFPGHGNTDSDSHYTLPVILQSRAEIDTLELYPFRELIKNGIASMMVAHLHIPSFDTTPNQAATLSPVVVDSLLRKVMGYEGLVFTDALNMKGVADYYPSGEIELKALLAGNDVLLYSMDVPQAWMRIHLAIQNCEIEQEAIDEKVKRILKAKYWAGLNKPQIVDTKNLINDLNTPAADYLNQKLYESAITVVKNENNLIPFKRLDNCNIASLVINDSLNNFFQVQLSQFGKVDRYLAGREISSVLIDSIVKKLEGYECVIVSIHNTNTRVSSGYGISDRATELIGRLNAKTKVITVVFGNVYTMSRLPDALNSNTLILSYEDTKWPQVYTAQALFGASRINGILPVTPVPVVKQGTGMPLNEDLTRLRYVDPFEVGLHPSSFSKIDSIAKKAISDKATPGCQVLVAWKGKVIYQKSFGTMTYQRNSRAVTNTDLYDIASITKIAATSLALMKLYEEDEIDIQKKASRYLHPLRKTNKKDLVIEDILTHQAGLKSWIPFWKNTLENGKPSYNIYHFQRDVNYSIQVADSMFILKSYFDKIWKEVYDSPVAERGTCVYSDIGLLLMQGVIEEVSGKNLDEYTSQNFYQPMGLYQVVFNPVNHKIPLERIAPTEYDREFRKRLVHGFVHDPASAMLGGITGHAGLFSDAAGIAVIMQMLLNGGVYGGERYLKKETINLFTGRYFTVGSNRRGLLFDKPEYDSTKNGPTALSASHSTFGHTGFTGTAAWADPEHDLIFIFLSNRVHPDASPNKLALGNYRTNMMQAVYDIILNIDLAGK